MFKLVHLLLLKLFIYLRPLFIFIIFISGIGMALIHSPMLAIIGVYFHKHRGLANSVFNGGGSVGGLMFAPIIVKIFDEYQFSGAMLIFSGLLMNICVSALLLRPIETYHKKKRKSIYKGAEITGESKPLLRENTVDFKNVNKISSRLEGIEMEAQLFHSDNKLNHKKSPSSMPNDSTFLQIYKQKSVEQSPKGSPLLQRVRAYSVGIRQKTFTEKNNGYDSDSNMPHRKNALSGVLDAISRSQVALYASSDGISGSFVSIDMQSTKNENKNYVPKEDKNNIDKKKGNARYTSDLKSLALSVLSTVFDIALLRNPVFITYLLMAFSIMSGLSLVPIYMPAHAKDIGVSNDKIGLLISLMMIIDLISKVMVGVIADRKLITTPTVFVIVAIVMGTTSHLLRFVNSFSTLVIFVVITGRY